MLTTVGAAPSKLSMHASQYHLMPTHLAGDLYFRYSVRFLCTVANCVEHNQPDVAVLVTAEPAEYALSLFSIYFTSSIPLCKAQVRPLNTATSS